MTIEKVVLWMNVINILVASVILMVIWNNVMPQDINYLAAVGISVYLSMISKGITYKE